MQHSTVFTGPRLPAGLAFHEHRFRIVEVATPSRLVLASILRCILLGACFRLDSSSPPLLPPGSNDAPDVPFKQHEPPYRSAQFGSVHAIPRVHDGDSFSFSARAIRPRFHARDSRALPLFRRERRRVRVMVPVMKI